MPVLAILIGMVGALIIASETSLNTALGVLMVAFFIAEIVELVRDKS